MVETPEELKYIGFTYNDVDIEGLSLLDGRSNFDFSEIDTSTYVSRNIRISIPIVSASMDTVTESRMGIGLSREGGFPIIHFNFRDPRKQIEEVKKVKETMAAVVENPVVLSPEHVVDRAAEIRLKDGPSTIPITEDGKPNGRLVGMLTKYDYSLELHQGHYIRERMVPVENMLVLNTSELPRNDEERIKYQNKKLLENRGVAMPIIDDDGTLLYIVTRSDIEKRERFPLATLDRKGRLRVGAAVKTRDEYKDVIKELVRVAVDAPCIDISNVMNAKYVYPFIEYLKKEHGDKVDIIAGNTGNPEGVKDLIVLGVDAVKVGISPGSICITGQTTGVYVPQGFAVYQCGLVARKYGIPLIADGGIKKIGGEAEDDEVAESGDILKALALGGNSVMVGSLLAGTEESPGKIEYDEAGNMFKPYRGMGSLEAMINGGTERGYNERVPEGVPGKVPYVGPLSEHILKLVTALKQGMEKIGARTIDEVYEKARLIPITEYAKQERKVGLKHYRREF